MQKLILSVAMFTALTVNAQLEVKEKVKSEKVWVVSKALVVPNITRIVADTDTSYALFYQDLQYTYTTSIGYLSFNNTEEIMQFVGLCLQVLEDGESLSIKLNGDELYLSKISQSCKISKGNEFFYINAKQLNTIKL